MKKLMISMVISSVLIFRITQASAITWGEPDNEHMNVGAMVVDYPGFGPFQMCSGTLIHPQIFLTAGHCTAAVEGLGITTVWVNFDQDALNEDTLMEVEQVINHPDYNMRPIAGCISYATNNRHKLLQKFSNKTAEKDTAQFMRIL
jgi:secreted trypsin-like serine protease